MNVLFWNLNGKDLAGPIAELASEHSIDVIVLCEAEATETRVLLRLLASKSKEAYVPHKSRTESRLRVYTRLSHERVRSLVDFGTISAKSITAPGCLPVVMVAVHSQSRLYWDQPTDRGALAARVRRLLERAEKIAGHCRSFLVGDFNSDPFEDALTTSEGLHAVMCKKVAAGVSRRVDKVERKLLYNPTWSLLGDRNATPGSYYYSRAVASCRFWHAFDQVLLRPSLIESFAPQSLAFVTTCGGRSLLNKHGRPDSVAGSDHLPLVFSLDLINHIPSVSEDVA